MSKLAVVYWSGTGNTEAMAIAVADGAKGVGAEVDLMTSEEFNANLMDKYEAIAFGCPSMGSEQLEECEFEPMFQSCENKLIEKKLGLFGSYGWGDGEWMRTWQEVCENDGANLIGEPVICNDAPDEVAIEACKKLGEALMTKHN